MRRTRTTSFLIDINVWLALSWRIHPCSQVAHHWLASLPRQKTRLLFCRITQLGLLRLMTNTLVMGESVLDVEAALAVFYRWTEDPRVEFAPEPRGLDPALRLALAEFAKKSVTKAIMDAYLAAFAEKEAATLVTFDKALARMAQRRGSAQKLTA